MQTAKILTDVDVEGSFGYPGIISKIKKNLPKGYGAVVCKNGIKEQAYGVALDVQTHGNELVNLCVGASVSCPAYKVLLIVKEEDGSFSLYEYGKDKIPFTREYSSPINL